MTNCAQPETTTQIVISMGASRGHQQVCARKQKWTKQEDSLLHYLTAHLGSNNVKRGWGVIAGMLKHRTPRQCRECYKNHTKPGILTGLHTYAQAHDMHFCCPSVWLSCAPAISSWW